MDKKEYLAKRKALLDEAQNLLNEGKIEEFEAKEKEIKDLDEKYEKFAKAQANMNALKDTQPAAAVITNVLVGSEPSPAGSAASVLPVGPEDKFNTKEYRVAFMNFCKTGKMAPEFMNVDTYTGTADAAAVIPTTIMNEVIKEMKSYGQVYNRVRKTNIKGGVEVPIVSLKPTATWITEATPSDRKKATVNTKVQFSYYGLECKLATSLLADATTLEMFEGILIGLIVEAMTKAMEIAVIKGTGVGQMLGVTVDPRIPAANVITLAAADFDTWDGWKKKVFAKIPLAYRAGGSWIMAAGTFEGYIDGMVDANGQPIGRVNYGIVDAPQERFGGREVILVEDDVISPYDTAANGDVVAVFCKLTDYCINSNLQMSMYRWLDHDTNQWVDKALLVADGKILDPNGVIIVKKGA